MHVLEGCCDECMWKCDNLQIKEDDRDLCEDDDDYIDELLDPESLRKAMISH